MEDVTQERFTPRLAAPLEHASDDDDEEDAWLALEVAKLEAEEASTPRDAETYRPQLMDAHAMHSLRRELRTSEARVQSDGHMREFVPRKPTTAVRPHTQQQRRRLGRPLAEANHTNQKEDNDQADEDVDPFVVQDGRKREYAEALREEVEQLNELYDQYDDAKRMLLDHLDMICSTKPSERTNSHDVYEKLDELLAFAAKCALPKAT